MTRKSDSLKRWAVVLAGGDGQRMEAFIRRWLGHPRPKQYCAFSRDFVEPAASRMVVMPMEGIHWSDWGRPQRIAETLAKIGKTQAFPADLCRRGMTVLMPYYGGCWGSPGNFSVRGAFDDARASLRLAPLASGLKAAPFTGCSPDVWSRAARVSVILGREETTPWMSFGFTS